VVVALATGRRLADLRRVAGDLTSWRTRHRGIESRIDSADTHEIAEVIVRTELTRYETAAERKPVWQS
jgi:hypothetical protein